jgi:segregation and condensation protein A
LPFSELFQSGMHKSTLVGMFLAILELVRHHGVRAEQSELHGEIWILPGENVSQAIDASTADNYEHGSTGKVAEETTGRATATGGRLQDRGS